MARDDAHGRGKDGARRGRGRAATVPWTALRAAAGRGAAHATQGAAWIALALSLALTVAAWRFADARERQAGRAELQDRSTQLAARLSARMLAYEQLLRGAAGLFAASGTPSRAEWRAFVGALGLAALPGIEGIGWAPRVPAAELGPHVDAVRRGGVPDYRVFPSGPRDSYAPVVYLEPMSGRAARALGFDMYGEPVRRAAMQAARDGGRPALSGRVVLVQEGGAPRQWGVLAYVPVYRPGAPTATVDERRAALIGWVYAAFRTGDLVEGALGGGREGLRVAVADAPVDGAPLFASGPDADEDPAALRVPVPMVDREWSMSVRPATDAAGSVGPRASTVVAVGGTTAGLLIFAIVWSLATTRSRALALADHMTGALRRANETLESRVRERTASLHDSNRRLASLNDRLRAIDAAFGPVGAIGPVDTRLASVASSLRAIVPAPLAMAVAFRADSGSGPVVGLDADPALPAPERERWRRAAVDADRSGGGPEPGGTLAHRMRAPLLDAHGRTRGFLALGRSDAAFEAEDRAVLSQFALRLGASLSLHETLARERAARAEAERADRAKEEMLAIVSHELRTPLNAIQGWLHVLRRRRADDGPLLGRAIDVIQRNLDTQVQLVDDLLDTARIAGGTLRMTLRPIELTPLLHAAVETVRPLADGKRIALDVSVAGDGFATVGDASRLEQVIWNLLTNAVKFTPPGGHVAVRLERLGWLAQLEVEDDGQGIDPAFLPHVFDRFRQADSSSARAAGGLGLGLALVRHIVLAHGGQVTARSEGAGRGACFTVTLPIGAGDPVETGGVDAADGDGRAAVGAPESAAAGLPLAGLRVLVVEDHDDSRELLADVLATQGADVRVAADGREAMAVVRSMPAEGAPAVLLCDIALPGENGYALLARIRRHERQEGVPADARMVAWALSAFTRAEDRERSLRAGFAEHLGKPLSQSDLIERLAALRADADDARRPASR